jgi:predicted Zn-dependent protease
MHKRSRSLLKLIGISAWDDFDTRSAKAKLDKKDYAGTVAACTAGLVKTPDNPKLLLMRAQSYIELHESGKAKADLDRILKWDPLNPDATALEAKIK